MATTFPPKPNNDAPQNVPRKFIFAFVIWITVTIGLLAAVYIQTTANSSQIDYLTFQAKKREWGEMGLSESMESLSDRLRKDFRESEQETARRLEKMETDLNNFQDFMRTSIAKQDEVFSHLNLLSERLVKKDKEMNGQGDFKSLQKEVEQMRNTFHSYMKSQDFFQVVNDMMDVYSKKFNQIYQELDEKNEVIQKLLQASQHIQHDSNKELRVKREDLYVGNVVSEENVQIPEISSHEEESLVHQVEAKIEDFKSKISHGVEETLEKMKDFTATTQEKLEPVKDLIVNSAEDSINKVKELAHSTKVKLSDLINLQKESPLEKVKEFAKSTGENFGAIKDFVVTNAEQSADKIQEISKTAKERIEPMKEAVSEKAQKVKEGVQKLGKNLEEKTKEIAEKAKNFAKKFF